MEKDLHKMETLVSDGTSRPEEFGGRFRRSFLNSVVCSVGATICIFGGISALIAGLFCVIVHGVIPGDVIFDHTGTVLLILGIPLLLVGSIFLDEIDPTP